MKAVVASWRSLDHKLPLLIAAVLLATVMAFTAGVHHLVQRVLLTDAGKRLQGGSAPLALSLGQSARRYRATLADVARDPAITDFLATGRNPDAARRALARVWGGPTPSEQGRVELRDARGVVVLDTVSGRAPSRSSWADRLIQADTVPPGVALIAPLVREGDAVFSESLVAIPVSPAGGEPQSRQERGTSSVTGYIVGARSIGARGVQPIRDLLGEDAVLAVGSPDEGVWTDLERATAAPPPEMRAGKSLIFATSVRGPGVGAATAVAGTPWVLWVEQPRATVLAPMGSLLKKLALLAGVFILTGALGAWALSRRITGPIVALASAADRVVPEMAPLAPEPRHRDEVARLTDAFTRMAARVDESHEALEARVAERTARLEAALHELELAQQELVKQERLALLGQLSSAVGHELRNPLGVMTNAIYVIDQCLPADAPSLLREYLDLLRGQIAASERIVGDLLDTARARTPEPEMVDLRGLVEAQLQRLGPATGVTIEPCIGADVPAVCMDPTQLSQIVLNLVTNAVQAMGDSGGGTITIEATPIDSGDRVRLSVVDTGPGIPPDVLERIFDPLFTTKARGLGLGLWVSQRLAGANGAALTATSSVGRGSSFTLDMPAAAAATAGTVA